MVTISVDEKNKNYSPQINADEHRLLAYIRVHLR